MRPDEYRPALDLRLPLLGFVPLQTGVMQRTRDPPGHVASRLAESGCQRTVRHDRADSRHDERDRRQQMGAQLTKPGRAPRILDFGTGSRASLACQLPFLVMRPRDDRDTFCRDTKAAKPASGSCRCGRIVEKGDDEWMRHPRTVRPGRRNFKESIVRRLSAERSIAHPE